MPEVGLEPMIPAFKRAKAVHALDRAAIVIGSKHWHLQEYYAMGSGSEYPTRL
jgi:hypothetical protein